MKYEEKNKKGISLWVKDSVIISAWKNNGNIAIPARLLKDMTIEEAFDFIEKSEYFCCTCAKPIRKNEVALQHFAGTYCEECAERYKKQNSKICSRCKKPLWKCYC